MDFKNIEEIQSLLGKTTSTHDRLQTSLLLLNSKFFELMDLIAPLKTAIDHLKSESSS